MSTDLKPGMLIRFRPYVGKPCYDINAQVGLVLDYKHGYCLVLVGEKKVFHYMENVIYEVLS